MSPYYDTSVADDALGCCDMTLAEWQSVSGMDPSSVAHWYSETAASRPARDLHQRYGSSSPGPRSRRDVSYQDLDQQPVTSPIVVRASSQHPSAAIDAIFIDGFESGDSRRLVLGKNTIPGGRSDCDD